METLYRCIISLVSKILKFEANSGRRKCMLVLYIKQKKIENYIIQVWSKSNPLWLYREVGNRFNGLDLIDRVPHELWMEVPDIVEETGTKTICKKGKMVVWWGLTNSCEKKRSKKTKEKSKDILSIWMQSFQE